MEESLSGQDWVLMDPGQELMILKRDGSVMTFPSREAADNFLSANDGIPSSFQPAKVIDIKSHLAPTKSIN